MSNLGERHFEMIGETLNRSFKKEINIFLVVFTTALRVTHIGTKSARTMPIELYKNKYICIYTHKYRIIHDFKLKVVTKSRDYLFFLPLEGLFQSAHQVSLPSREPSRCLRTGTWISTEMPLTQEPAVLVRSVSLC